MLKKFIHITEYQFDQHSEKKWEVRENGSICNDADLLNWSVNQAEMEAWARSYVNAQIAKGHTCGLTVWEYSLQRYLQIYPEHPRDAALLKVMASLTSEEFKAFRPLLHLRRVCDGCHTTELSPDIALHNYQFRERERGVINWILCDPCYAGAKTAEVKWKHALQRL